MTVRPGAVRALAALAVVVPLVTAAVALRRPQWFPTLDLAMTELRVADVGSGETPLVGLPGRIGTFDEQGSHPGPLSFYALAPVYRLLGSSAWALQVATLVLNALAAVIAVGVARRTGGVRMAAAVALVLVVLAHGYGIATLAEPWNPNLALLWWIVVLLSTWAVLRGDVALLPLVVAAASFAAQTHIPYLGLGGGMAALAAVGAVVVAGRRAAGVVVASVGLGALLWLPPVLDELDRSPGNLSILWDHFATPPEEPVGLAGGVGLALRHLDPAVALDSLGEGALLEASGDVGDGEGSPVRGGAVAAVVLASGVVAWRARRRDLVALHVAVGVALVLGAVAMGRIFGKVWYYLMLWSWGTAAIAVVAVAATAASMAGPRFRRATLAGTVAATVLGAVVLTVDAADAERSEERLSATLGALVGPTRSALDEDDGVYLVTWSDAAHFGSQGYGLVSELERAGFDVGALEPYRVPITDHRVVDPDDAAAMVTLANGPWIERWRRTPGAVEVAFVDPRSPAETEAFEQLRSGAINGLRDAGLDELVPLVDGNLFGASIDARLPPEVEDRLARMLDLGLPTAVFVSPPGTEPS